MDKKFFSKTSNFFRKEGFYVILFVCLCVVATVAAVTSRTAKPKNPPVVNDTAINDTKTTGSGLIAEEPAVDYPNAMQVKEKETAKPSANTGITVPKAGTAPVSKAVDTTFAKPVEGTLARAYTEDPVWSDSTETWRPNFGMDIKAELGKPVVAVLDGKVLEVGEGEYGKYVAIDHQNGLTSVYANLDPDIKVTKGQSVKKSAQIGKVGNTTLRTGYEKYGSHLHFEVIKGKDVSNDDNKVDPAKYVKYTVAK
jgi:murein DD-endopeptidase MepM/ murein hydrolase activator NlpD